MKTFFQRMTIAVALAVVFGGLASTTANAQVVNEILKRVDDHYRSLQSLRADVKRELYNAQLRETDPYSGSLLLIPNKKDAKNLSLRLNWTKPETETISIHNGEFIAFKPSSGQAYVGKSNSAKVKSGGGNVLSVLSMGKKDIKANYDVAYIGQEVVGSAQQTWHLKLTPKVKSDFKFADVWIDGDGMPIMAKVTLPNNDTDTIVLSGVRKNETINLAELKLVLPKSVKVIKA